MRICFKRRHQVQQHDGKGPVYEAGSIHDFEGMVAESYAKKYVERGYAELVDSAISPLDHDHNGAPGGSMPAAPGDVTMTPAELLAALATNPPMDWNTWRAEVAKVLGDDTPARKRDIVDALRRLVEPEMLTFERRGNGDEDAKVYLMQPWPLRVRVSTALLTAMPVMNGAIGTFEVENGRAQYRFEEEVNDSRVGDLLDGATYTPAPAPLG